MSDEAKDWIHEKLPDFTHTKHMLPDEVVKSQHWWGTYLYERHVPYCGCEACKLSNRPRGATLRCTKQFLIAFRYRRTNHVVVFETAVAFMPWMHVKWLRSLMTRRHKNPPL